MHGHAYLHALLFTCATAAEIHRRLVVPRPGRTTPDPVDDPSVPTYHEWGDDVPYTGSSTTHLGEDGTLDSSTQEYEPAQQPNRCMREECAELTGEIAKELIKQLADNLGGSSSTSTSQSPIVTAQATRSPIPNLDVAKTMTLQQEELALFDFEEQNLYLNNRLCFYANVAGRYASVATASPTATSLARRQDAIDMINSAATGTATPLASSDAAYYQSALWSTWMPDYLLRIYRPATANGSLATATTTCSGLDGAPSITLPYVQARVSSLSSAPTPTPGPAGDEVHNGANIPPTAGGSAAFAAVVAFVALIAW